MTPKTHRPQTWLCPLATLPLLFVSLAGVSHADPPPLPELRVCETTWRIKDTVEPCTPVALDDEPEQRCSLSLDDHDWVADLLAVVVEENPNTLSCDGDPPLAQVAQVRYDGGAEIDVTLEVGLDCDVGDGRWYPTDTPFDGQRLLVCDLETEACELVPVEESGEFPQTQVFPPLMFKGLGFCQVGSARSATGRAFRIGDKTGPTYTYTVDCVEHPDLCAHTIHMIVSR